MTQPKMTRSEMEAEVSVKKRHIGRGVCVVLMFMPLQCGFMVANWNHTALWHIPITLISTAAFFVYSRFEEIR